MQEIILGVAGIRGKQRLQRIEPLSLCRRRVLALRVEMVEHDVDRREFAVERSKEITARHVLRLRPRSARVGYNDDGLAQTRSSNRDARRVRSWHDIRPGLRAAVPFARAVPLHWPLLREIPSDAVDAAL